MKRYEMQDQGNRKSKIINQNINDVNTPFLIYQTDQNKEKGESNKNNEKSDKNKCENQDQVNNTLTSPSPIPQTVEQARKLYASSSDKVVGHNANNSTDITTATHNIIEANELIEGQVKELHKLAELHQQLLAAENSLKLSVMNYMQLHTYLKMGDYFLASWKSSTRKMFDIPQFKIDFPDLYDCYAKEISLRTFRLY